MMDDIELMPFCSTEDSRKNLMNPWSRDGFTWASNGFILIRVAYRDSVPPNPKAPGVKEVMKCHVGAVFSELPSVKWPYTPREDTCLSCRGRRFKHDCPSCYCKCLQCEGTGLDYQPVSVTIRGTAFSVRYIKMIIDIPGLEFYASKKYLSNGYYPFRFQGGIGVIAARNEAELHLGDIESLEPLATS